MVEKWSCRNPLTIQERLLIKEAIDLNMSYSEMSTHVGRCKSVVMRESKRLGDHSTYNAEKAQEHFEDKQKRHGFRQWQSLKKQERDQEQEKNKKRKEYWDKTLLTKSLPRIPELGEA